MEKNNHNDGLEEFLRKSFNQYDDSPSDSLWDKIEADLDQPKVVPISHARPRWTWAAAAMILVLLIGQCVYFQKEKKALTEIIKMQSDKISELEKRLDISQNDSQKPSSNDQYDNAKNIVEKGAEKPSYTSVNQEKSITKKITKPHTVSAIISSENNNSSSVLAPFPSLFISNTKLAQSNNSQVSIPGLDGQFFENIPAPTPIATPSMLENGTLHFFPSPVTILHLPVTTAPVAKRTPSVSIGAHVAFFSTKEKITRVIQRPSGGPSRTFNNTNAMTGTTQMTGLQLFCTTSKKWQFGTGLDYRTADLSSSHQAKLRFQDRRQSINNRLHDFAYALNTPSGQLEIEVRADQTDPNETISEFENVNIEVKTRQTTSHITLPIWAGKEIKSGRSKAYMRSGLLVNFLTNQSLDISTNISGGRLRHDRTNFTRGNHQGLKKTTIDFMATAGLSQRIGQHLAVHISPIVIVPLSSRHNDPYIKSSGLSAGVGVGLNYIF